MGRAIGTADAEPQGTKRSCGRGDPNGVVEFFDKYGNVLKPGPARLRSEILAA